MSEYRVIKFFTDLQDNKHAYNVGDIFPRDGVTVDEARLAELSSNKNRQGKPLIKKIEETKPVITDDVAEAVVEDLPETTDANVLSDSLKSAEPIAETTEDVAETIEDKPKSKKRGRRKNVNAE